MSETKVYVATLVNGRTHFQGPREFKQGVPQIVDKEMADTLSKSMNMKPIGPGERLYKKKFHIEYITKNMANKLIEKYGKTKSDRDQIEQDMSIQVVEAVQEVDDSDSKVMKVTIAEAIGEGDLDELKKTALVDDFDDSESDLFTDSPEDSLENAVKNETQPTSTGKGRGRGRPASNK